MTNSHEVANKRPASDASVHMDAIRGLAALTVFLGHGRGLFLKSGFRDALVSGAPATVESSSTRLSPPVASNTAPHETLGHEAVIIFFVLSGYFVGGSVLRATRKGVFSWRTYLFQRLTRLWVVLIPALLLGWGLDLCGTHLLHSTQNIYSAPLGQEDVLPGLVNRLTPAVFLGNLLFLQGILTQTFGTNASLWSLSYEFWYYIFFPLLVIVVLPSKAISQRVFAAVLLLTAASLCGREISSYFLLWLFGVVVALLPLRLPSNRTRLTIFAGSATFIATMFVMLKYRVDLYLSDVVLATTFSFLLWSILHATGVTVSSLYRSAAQGLSNMSYTLYLVHLPCFALISAILMPTWQGWRVSQNSLLATLAIYAAVFGIAVLMYGCFERNTDRIRHRLSGLISTRKRPTDSPRPPQMVAIRSAN